MSHQSKLSSSPNATSRRRSSIASEKTLVDTPSRIQDATEEKYQESENCLKSSSYVKASASSRLLPMKMGKALEKVKLKLRESDSKSKPRSRRPARDGYPDSAFMWRALVETRL
ncbi:hypothetical protein F4811DRAFT_520178 [Daldinia bambusicola]|nr:hypothetical protein F4811DRAFT_520178 [Daldinia bambusicola]